MKRKQSINIDEELAEKINKELDAAFYVTENDKKVPFVCLSCDKFLKRSEVCYIKKELLEKNAKQFYPKRDLHPDVVKYYSYDGTGSSDVLSQCLFSSKTVYISKGRNKDKFVICNKCRDGVLNHHRTPKYAIANYFEIGEVPSVISELTDVEACFISDVRCQVNLLTFQGGHKGIKGWHSLIKTNMKDKIRVLNSIRDSKVMPNTIVVVLHGSMTDGQKKQIKRKIHIRRDVCLTACRWLSQNHEHYEKVVCQDDFDIIPEVIVVDDSKEIQSLNTNLESHEEIRVAIPDVTLNESTGGLTTLEDLDELVGDKMIGGDVEINTTLTNSEYVRDYVGSNLTVAFLKHYPYGYGGPETKRVMQDGRIRKLYFDEYFSHISNLSMLRFQEPLIQLISFNMYFRCKMLTSAFWRIREENLSERISNVLPEDVLDELQRRWRESYEQRKSRRSIPQRSGQRETNEFLQTVSSMSNSLPHSDESARKARRDLFSLQIAMGRPDIFFSFSPSDSNSLIVTVYAGIEEELYKNWENLSYDELNDKSTKRSRIRFKYPGLSTMNFEIVLKLVLKYVIGWGGTDGKGYFGTPEAYFYAVEEQSRKLLHAHFVLWIKEKEFDYRSLENVNCGARKRTRLEKKVTGYMERVESIKIFGDGPIMLPHDCEDNRKIVVKEEPQQLRMLRHKEGCKIDKGAVYSCEKCNKCWSSNEAAITAVMCRHEELLKFVEEKNGNDMSKMVINEINSFDISKTMDHARCQRYLKKVAEEFVYRSNYAHNDVTQISDALYNVHSSCHVGTCFKEGRPECRYKFPKMRCPKSKVEYEESKNVCYSHNGEAMIKYRLNITQKRSKYDIFSNSSCSLITKLFKCNSNIRIIQDPLAGFYVCKYCSKSTQQDEGKDYIMIENYVMKRLSVRKFDSSSSECLSRLIGYCLAHNAQNVISATMAKYLVNNGSRFGKSHDISYIPISELKRIISESKFSLRIESVENEQNEQSTIVESLAINYLFRPIQLEDVTVHTFFTEYYTVTSKKVEDVEDYFKFTTNHPAHKYKVVGRRMNASVPGIYNWLFPDASRFSGNILQNETPTSDHIESYCQSCLILLCPFRKKEDLQLEGSYLRKYRQVYYKYIYPHKRILDNIQDFRNAQRFQMLQDDLEISTVPYVSENTTDDENNNDEMLENSEIQSDYDKLLLDLLVVETSDEDMAKERPDKPADAQVSFDEIRERGKYNCGFSHLSPPEEPLGTSTNTIPFISHEAPAASTDNRHYSSTTVTEVSTEVPKTLSKKIVGVLSIRVTQRSVSNLQSDDGNSSISTRRQEDIDGQSQSPSQRTSVENESQTPTSPEIINCNGTANSIVKWANKVQRYEKVLKDGTIKTITKRLDKYQRQALMIICSHFVLSYFKESQPEIETLEHGELSLFRVAGNQLRKLGGDVETLRMFLDGPGGSGKSEVIQEVLSYAKGFCRLIKVPFTTDTILVTASTGVAATLIRGQTLHKACLLRQKKKPADADITRFANVRLIIVDEISMVCSTTLCNLDQKLRELRSSGDYYGNINMLFVGDFRQLTPVGKANNTIYERSDLAQWYLAINTYVELLGRYRFNNDPTWGAILDRFHRGNPLPEDFLTINARVINRRMLTEDGTTVPPGIKYCTHANCERDAINSGLFVEKLIRDNEDTSNMLLVFADCLKIMKDTTKKTYQSLHDSKYFYENCSEFDCKFPSQRSTRMEPVLKLYPGAPVMLTDNIDVENGLANGTEGHVTTVELRSGRQVFRILVRDKYVNAVYASDVKTVGIKPDILDKEVRLEPTNFTFTAHFPRPMSLSTQSNDKFRRKMKARQLCFILNSATTGHKLQGSSRDELLLNGFWYGSNWAYVALSRVRTLCGLFLREPLKPNKDYSVAKSLERMRAIFREEKSLPEFYDDYVESLTQ